MKIKKNIVTTTTTTTSSQQAKKHRHLPDRSHWSAFITGSWHAWHGLPARICFSSKEFFQWLLSGHNVSEDDGAARAPQRPRCDPRARGARAFQRAVLTGPQPQCIGLPAAEARQFFRYCLGLRGGGSSHFAPICTAKLRRDQSSGGGGWDKCTECHIRGGHQGL